MTVKNDDAVITTREIEQRFSITRQTIANWINAGHIPSPTRAINGSWIWDKDTIQALEEVLPGKHVTGLQSPIALPLRIENRRYLGGKRKLLPFINQIVADHTSNVLTIADVFAGTGVVADLFRTQGRKIIANDLLYSNYIPYLTYFGDQEVNEAKIYALINRFNKLDGTTGYVTENFGGRYFSEANAAKINEAREIIASAAASEALNQREEAFLLTSLLYAADKVANTVGHYDAYRKTFDNNIDIVFRVPTFNDNQSNLIFNMDANDLVRNIEADLVYVDTPYNSRGYENAYHVLENIARWEKPDVEGVARKDVTRKTRTSAYNRVRAPQAFDDLIQHTTARYILVSYNNMGLKGNSRSNARISHEEIHDSLATRGSVRVFETDFAAFTTGKSSIDNHKELLYLCEIS